MSLTEAAADVGTRFLEALTRRDYETLGACFEADGTLRGVVPPGPREADGREAAPFADTLRLRWVAQGVDPELGLDADEQTAYAEITNAEIVQMRLACSGHRPL